VARCLCCRHASRPPRRWAAEHGAGIGSSETGVPAPAGTALASKTPAAHGGNAAVAAAAGQGARSSAMTTAPGAPATTVLLSTAAPPASATTVARPGRAAPRFVAADHVAGSEAADWAGVAEQPDGADGVATIAGRADAPQPDR